MTTDMVHKYIGLRVLDSFYVLITTGIIMHAYIRTYLVLKYKSIGGIPSTRVNGGFIHLKQSK